MFTEEMPFLSTDDLEWIMGRGLAECLPWPDELKGARNMREGLFALSPSRRHQDVDRSRF